MASQYNANAFLGMVALRARAFHGGAAVAAGTYGCVFNPAIPCRGDAAGVASGVYTNAVSKVMNEEDAQEEYKETGHVRAIANVIPFPLRDYLVIPLRPPCRVNFTPADLRNADLVCTNFEPLMRTNLGAHADDVRALTQVNGGMNLKSALQYFDLDTFKHINTGLMQLTDVVRHIGLHGGIHGDIKDVNLVYNATDHKVRIIDWGFFQFLSADYMGTHWDKFETGGVNPIMQNEMLSTWIYTKTTSSVPAASTPVAQIAEWAKRELETLLQQPKFLGSNAAHLRMLSRRLSVCLRASKEVASKFVIHPYTVTPLPNASLELTNLLIGHAVAVVQADYRTRPRYLIDTVLRMNQDIYGILCAYMTLISSHVPVEHDQLVLRTFYTASRYLWDPKYAVEPYDVTEMQASFAQLNAGTYKVTPFPAPRDPSSNVTIMARHDPNGWRAFNPDTFDDGAAMVDTDAYNLEEVLQAMKPSPSSTMSSSTAPSLKRGADPFDLNTVFGAASTKRSAP